MEAKPKFVPPPPCIPCTTDGGDADGVIEISAYKNTALFLSLALNLVFIVVLGCLYATSHIP